MTPWSKHRRSGLLCAKNKVENMNLDNSRENMKGIREIILP